MSWVRLPAHLFWIVIPPKQACSSKQNRYHLPISPQNNLLCSDPSTRGRKNILRYDPCGRLNRRRGLWHTPPNRLKPVDSYLGFWSNRSGDHSTHSVYQRRHWDGKRRITHYSGMQRPHHKSMFRSKHGRWSSVIESWRASAVLHGQEGYPPVYDCMTRKADHHSTLSPPQ